MSLTSQLACALRKAAVVGVGVFAGAGCTDPTGGDTCCSFCKIERLGDLEPAEIGAVGVSPSQVLNRLDGSVIEVTMLPDNEELDPEAGFETTITFEVSEDGLAWEDYVDGNVVAPPGPPEPYLLPCPTGNLLTIPIQLDIQLGIGGHASGDARVIAMSDDPAAIWLSTDALKLEDAPVWVMDLADSVRCSDPGGTLTVHFYARGSYLIPDSSWRTPQGGIDIHGTDDIRQCATRFLRWTAQAYQEGA